ncbi:helicase-exonuclease AddAB subunit AddA [Lactobacillus taiwanensis]|uniref:helicase-exonuclease AddAB subunit AddA n=1 Tax=Lactobacillus taiwanensis TaxID=508451 RepID=UPI000B98BAAC|nr:helicase-exonuclease AddAB subunit AddA [Lactobacillus taiwanensis]OYS21919.1 helicase-exonuclease AddAB subunit AddA [Lactobacillus taiwanensis]OYS24713.1 helicase-exonuclease AddAB subunit AddA [Lactobacillus taiwanensis]OYS25892.1 helicase-exonuclease AddAB subunit AddA [Lactobacillus taiwanensis]OYS27403.1 helicase-exonuclease AddAB subunit AddA [Lactobacillus taiwanensis]OYS29597.1 helicase-exonuclease AddAB subunit AddA [Lactobacillus taiwanensis]
MTNFTREQNQAINDHGRDILVSASAGSGKTTVLVERVLRRILSGTPVSSLLIITFTKAAAREMKERIKQKISDQLEIEPDNQFLRNQLLDIDTANISTIDSFCLDVIRRFYYVIDLDPRFSVLTDETQAELLKERALREIESEYLEEDNQDFQDFYDNFSGDRDAEGARNLLLQLYNTATSEPNYENFLNNLANYYHVEDKLVESSLWQTQIKPLLIKEVSDLKDEVKKLFTFPEIDGADLSKVKENYDIFANRLDEFLKALKDDCSYNEIRASLMNCKFEKTVRKSKKWSEDSIAVYQESQDLKSDLNDQLKKIFASFFVVEEKEQIKVLKKSEKLVETIIRVEKKLIKKFSQLKREQNLIDYSDMEQFAFNILTTDTSNAHLAREYYQEKFNEILIDEYQDVNALQENIIRAIKKKGQNTLFMVGDVKQSIYSFRQARPDLFLSKYHAYGQDENSERIVLADNFRSTKRVTETVNVLFDPILTTNFGGIDYKKEGQLQFGADYYPADLPTASEYIFSDKKRTQSACEEKYGDEIDFSEIQMVIARIKQLKKENFQIWDRRTQLKRPLEYSDIAIITRTRSDNLQVMQEFAKADLPLFVTDAQNYFQTFELIMIMNYLRLIDNPQQDIPLVAVLRSPLFNFKEPELAQIRVKSRSGNFYTALASFASVNSDLGKKCKGFLQQLETLRSFAATHRISELIWSIYEKTHLLEIVTGLPNGQQRRVNLESLYERATSYESAGFKGLYQFISFIERMRKNQKDLAQPLLSDKADNAVKLMTIHASKGLEFPVVFVMGLGHKYQTRDLSGNFTISKDSLGLTVKEKDYRIDSLVKSVADVEKRQQMLEEEARILYVGLTRAQQKLILVASVNDLESKQKKWLSEIDQRTNTLPLVKKINAQSPLDFLGPKLEQKHEFDQKIDDMTLALEEQDRLYYLKFNLDFKLEEIRAHNEDTQELSSQINTVVKDLYDFHYPFGDATKTTAYQSVSEIKKVFNDPMDTELENSRLISSSNRYLQPIDETPTFLEEQKFTGAEIGTAMHLVLQYYNYEGSKNEKNLEEEIKKLVELGKLNPLMVPYLSKDALNWFVMSEFAKDFWKKPANLHRESQFSSLVNASELFNNFSDPAAKILVHGTVDGYFEADEGLILFDYKTDFVDKKHEEQAIKKIKQKYTGQLRLYEQALNEMTDSKKVIGKYLILLDAKKVVPVD